jgi:hypothetical protein
MTASCAGSGVDPERIEVAAIDGSGDLELRPQAEPDAGKRLAAEDVERRLDRHVQREREAMLVARSERPLVGDAVLGNFDGRLVLALVRLDFHARGDRDLQVGDVLLDVAAHDEDLTFHGARRADVGFAQRRLHRGAPHR